MLIFLFCFCSLFTQTSDSDFIVNALRRLVREYVLIFDQMFMELLIDDCLCKTNFCDDFGCFYWPVNDYVAYDCEEKKGLNEAMIGV